MGGDCQLDGSAEDRPGGERVHCVGDILGYGKRDGESSGRAGGDVDALGESRSVGVAGVQVGEGGDRVGGWVGDE